MTPTKTNRTEIIVTGITWNANNFKLCSFNFGITLSLASIAKPIVVKSKINLMTIKREMKLSNKNQALKSGKKRYANHNPETT